MKKLFLNSLIISAVFLMLGLNTAVAQTNSSSTSVKKTMVKKVEAKTPAKPKAAAKNAKTTAPNKTTIDKDDVAKKVEAKAPAKPKTTAVAEGKKTAVTPKWTASGLKALGPMSAFDYSTTIKKAVMKKIENYAKRNNFKTIDDKVVKSMRE